MTTPKQAAKLHARLSALGIKPQHHYAICSMWAKTQTTIQSLTDLTSTEYTQCMQLAGQLLDEKSAA